MTDSLWKLGLVFSWFILIPATFAKGSAFELLKNESTAIAQSNRLEGWSYLVSGAMVLGISTPAYYLTQSPVMKLVYSVGQTAASGAISYGATLILSQSDSSVFKDVLEKTKGLSLSQKNELAIRYYKSRAEQARTARHLQSLTFGVNGGLLLVSALNTEERDIRTATYFLSGINILGALSRLFIKTPEEKFLTKLHRSKKKLSQFELSVGQQNLAFSYHW